MQGQGVVFEGKTLDDAVKKGLEALGLMRAEVMITVLEEGSGGFLGLGARPYRVRMMPRPRRESSEGPPRREREGRRDRDGRRPRGERGGRDRDHERRPGRGTPREARGAERGEERKRPADAGPRREPAPARSAEPGGERRRRRDRGRERSGDRGNARPAPAPPDHAPRAEREPHPERHEMSPTATETAAQGPTLSVEDLQNLATEQTRNLLKAMGFDATVSARAEDTSVEVRAEVPKDSDLLVGPKGEVRQALQHLLNRMVNRSPVSRYHLQLEINDFWHQREGELQALARSLADEVVGDGNERLTEYLNAQERRIIHVALREDSRVKTYALGDGMIKRLAVAPADFPEGPRAE